MTYTWAPVLPAQVVDDVATNALGAAVTQHDVLIAALTPNTLAFRGRVITSGVVASVTVSGLPATLRQLHIAYSARSDNAVAAQLLYAQVGADASALYSYTYLQMQNVTLTGFSSHNDTKGAVGGCPGSTAPAGVFSSGTVDYVTWDNANTGSLGWQFASGLLGSAVANQFSFNGAGNYTGGAARTSVTFFPQAGNFVAGCDFQIMGWA